MKIKRKNKNRMTNISFSHIFYKKTAIQVLFFIKKKRFILNI